MHVLRPVSLGIWITDAPVRIVGMRLSTNMTVLDLGEGRLMLHSPIAMTPALRAEVDALGTVAHLYAPSVYHHLWIAPWATAYPLARVHAPRALASKQPELRIDRAHDEAPDAELASVFDEHHIDGMMLEETVLVHRPNGSLVVADLVHNIGRPTDLWTVVYSRLMGFYDRVALSRVLRLAAFSDRRAARRSLDAILDHSFERLLVGHGAPVARNAHESLAGAYEWLPASRGALPAPRGLASAPCG
jgi:hypothetical protein